MMPSFLSLPLFLDEETAYVAMSVACFAEPKKLPPLIDRPKRSEAKRSPDPG